MQEFLTYTLCFGLDCGVCFIIPAKILFFKFFTGITLNFCVYIFIITFIYLFCVNAILVSPQKKRKKRKNTVANNCHDQQINKVNNILLNQLSSTHSRTFTSLYSIQRKYNIKILNSFLQILLLTFYLLTLIN